LHGDLHHDNLLSATRMPYVAIDPKGVLGEPAYEIGAFLRNPLPDFLARENPHKLMERRVDMTVEYLGFDRQRIIGWGFAQAVLSAVWCDEDGVDCGAEVIQVAEILTHLK
jgi:streptomycin 6-kinase